MRSSKMDKKLFNDGLKTLDAELVRVKKQQHHWNKGHKIDKEKLYLNLNAARLTLEFMTKEARKDLDVIKDKG